MKKLALFTTLATLTIVGLVASPRTAGAGNPCARKAFKTQTVKNACQTGGQTEAKKAMKTFLAQAKKKNASVKNCKSCHSGLAPNYTLNGNGLSLYWQSGGR